MRSWKTFVSKSKRRVATTSLVHERFRFFFRELVVQTVGRFTINGVYTVGTSQIYIKHGSDDVFIFEEIFQKQYYAFPVEVERILPPKELKVLDLGGNVGLFGLWITESRPGSSLTAIEADPANAERYRQFIAANGLEWKILEAFASNRSGTVRFDASSSAASKKSATNSGIDVPMLDIVPILAHFDVVKMDIEGGEWDILTDPRFTATPPPVLVLEYHPEFCPTNSPKLEVERLLEDAGYETLPIMTDGDVGMLWAYRPL